MIFEKDILKNRVVVTMGQSPKSEFYNKEGIGIPFLQGNRTFGEKYPYIDTYCSEPKRIAQTGDVLMSVRAPVGDVNIATEEICIGRGLCSLRMKNGNNEYLYYLLKSFNKYIVNQESGTVFGSINKKQIENLELPFPNDNEQKRISDLLSTLDNKIYLNTKITQTLEKIAQLIFKHWFIDFEFPNENGEPYKSSGGKFKESEIGSIPKNWQTSNLNEIIFITSGKRPKLKSETNNQEFCYPLIGASSQMGFVNDYLYDEKILIIGRVGTLGVVQRFIKKCWPSDNTLVIKSDYYNYVYQILKNIDYSALNRGSTQPLLTQTDIKNYKIIIPEHKVLQSYEKITGKLFEVIEKNKTENATLIKLRDTLLPKLMSGEIRVPEAEQEVEACLQKNS